MRLRGRFFLSHAAVAGLALIGCAVAFLFTARLALRAQQSRAEEAALGAFALAAREAALDQQPLAVNDFMRAELRDRALAFAAFQDPSGFRLTLPEVQAVRAREALGTRNADANGLPVGGLRLGSREYRTPGGTGRVVLAWDRGRCEAEISGRLKTLLPALGLALAFALGLGALAAGAVARELARPLAELRRATHAVREGQRGGLVQALRGDEIGDLARDFNRMTVELGELDRLKRDFVNGVTHDLGTPLHSMRAAAHYLQSGQAGPLTAAQADYLLILSNATEMLRQFLENLLSVARIEAGKVEPFAEDLDADRELLDLAALYRPQALERGLNLECTAPRTPTRLRADRMQFRQMALNLLTNALKFTDRGGIRMEWGAEGGQWYLRVTDSGIGIDPRYHELIFDKFFRVRQTGNGPERRGTGLGLAIARGLARAHGGSLDVRSALGAGATFTLRLPAGGPRS